MAFEVLSTLSWNVLGTFEDADHAREAIQSSLSEGGAEPEHLLVTEVVDGTTVREFTGVDLVSWAGAHAHA